MQDEDLFHRFAVPLPRARGRLGAREALSNVRSYRETLPSPLQQEYAIIKLSGAFLLPMATNGRRLPSASN